MENINKSLHGRNAIESVELLLKMFIDKGYIEEVVKSYRNGYPDCDPKQFYFQFLVQFKDGDKWIIQSTTSFRERMNGFQWNAEHLKALDSSITKAIVVYPEENEKEVNSFRNYNARIHREYQEDMQKGNLFSVLDEVVSFQELYHLLEEKGLEDSDTGSTKAKQGYNFEEWLVAILNHPSNLVKWNTHNPVEVGFHYRYFKQLLESFGISPQSNIDSIVATDDVPLLPKRPDQKRPGQPKTDILIDIVFSSGELRRITLSLKRSSNDWVACHQFAVHHMIHDLQIQDQELIDSLLNLQAVGGAYTLLDSTDFEVLNRKLPYYNDQLANWALAGIGGPGIPDLHIIQYFCIYKNETDKFEIYDRDHYIKKNSQIKGYYGTPFKWTYPSKQKTKQLQLKMFIS